MFLTLFLVPREKKKPFIRKEDAFFKFFENTNHG